MSFDSVYLEQVDMLLEVLPVLNKFDCFALKGGTAINLFLRDMPRLSVDIDLAYLPIEPREIFLANLTSQLLEMKKLYLVIQGKPILRYIGFESNSFTLVNS